MKAIFRTQKLKSLRSVSGCLKHNFRDIDTPNANPEQLADNEVLIGPQNAQEAMSSYKGELPEKIRKNAVMAVECLATASPEFFKDKTKEEQQAFFNDSLKFIQDRFGADNVISAVVHNDESTPHLQALVIPKVNGKLNARSLIGGSKHELSKLQTDYHKRVEHHGLERGQEKSKAKHTTIKDFYTNIEQTRNEVNQELKTATRQKEMAQASAGFDQKKIDELKKEVTNLQKVNKTLVGKLKEAYNDFKRAVFDRFKNDFGGIKPDERGRDRVERGRKGDPQFDRVSSRETGVRQGVSGRGDHEIGRDKNTVRGQSPVHRNG